jgi:hypothetical protein
MKTRLARGLAVAAGLAVMAVLLPAGALGARPPRPGQPAPEITGGPWINSEPLSLARLRGRVVLVEFWTYG